MKYTKERKRQIRAVIAHLAKTNMPVYNFEKAVEELTELTEVLIKKVLKTGTDKEPKRAAIVEEIGDARIRLAVLEAALDCQEEVNERIDFKIKKYESYIAENKYAGKI